VNTIKHGSGAHCVSVPASARLLLATLTWGPAEPAQPARPSALVHRRQRAGAPAFAFIPGRAQSAHALAWSTHTVQPHAPLPDHAPRALLAVGCYRGDAPLLERGARALAGKVLRRKSVAVAGVAAASCAQRSAHGLTAALLCAHPTAATPIQQLTSTRLPSGLRIGTRQGGMGSRNTMISCSLSSALVSIHPGCAAGIMSWLVPHGVVTRDEGLQQRMRRVGGAHQPGDGGGR
jgi:hypothetical protein